MEAKADPPRLGRERMKRCADWLMSQGARTERVIALLPSHSEADEASVATALSLPTAVDEDSIKPMKVPLRKLRTDGLRMECEWRSCLYVTADYEAFQRHVRTHIPQLHIITGPSPKYMCLWDICGHQSADSREMVRHINYHAYHAKLMAVGVNALHNLNLTPCSQDSTKRNILPLQKEDYLCMWGDCSYSFTAIQDLYTHMKEHLLYGTGACMWGGCGVRAGAELRVHVRSHTKEKLIACGHCGCRYVNNALLRDHLQKQNIGADGGFKCGVCGRVKATQRLLHLHERQHVCDYACSYCDMTTPTLSALSLHIRYRHLPDMPQHRPFKCDQCDLAAKTLNDLKRHRRRHFKAKIKKEKTSENCSSGAEGSDDENFAEKKPRELKKYICHMCPDGENKIFSRGARLSNHLMKDHGVQWPDGHCRFRYQKQDDGFYRLTTTRYESLEVSRQIMRGMAKEPITDDLSIRVRKKSSATKNRPTLYAVTFNSQDSTDATSEEEPAQVEGQLENEEQMVTEESIKNEELIKKEESIDNDPLELPIEITMCDVDSRGNVIRSEVVDFDKVVIE